MVRTLLFSVGVMATFIAGMGILVAQDWARDGLSVEETAECLALERNIDTFDEEIALREARLAEARAEADELALQYATLKDTARVDTDMQAEMLNLQILQDEAEELFAVNTARIAQALQNREAARDAFNLGCSGRRYDPAKVAAAKRVLGEK